MIRGNKPVMNESYLNKITLGSSDILLKNLEDNSVDVVLTDPPYFLDKLDNSWSVDDVHTKSNQTVVTSLPAGMKFSKQQGILLYDWYYEISKELLRILKPGGFFFTFSSPRLYHRMACAVDDAGFELRDALIWLYTQNQPKGMSLDHIIKKRDDLTDDEKDELIDQLRGWKTPQLKSCFEPIVMGQKPKDGTFLNNYLNYGIGMFNTNIKSGINRNMHPSNVLSVGSISPEIDRVFLVDKPTKKEKGEYNTHKTVKPKAICERLLRLTDMTGEMVVLDPFSGSGTSCVVAKELGLNYIGIEINQEYKQIADRRLSEV